MKHIFIITVFTFISLSAFSQKAEIKGYVFCSETNSPIEFVNVGIVNIPLGTITNNKGFFRIEIPTEYQNLEMKISSIGYEPLKYQISEFLNLKNDTIYLPRHIYLLEKVVINKNQNTKIKEIGSKSSSSKIVTGWSRGAGKGGERGILINPKKKSYFVKELKFHVADNGFKKVNVRLHIRTVNNNEPDKELLTENIIIPVTIANGWVSKDLSDYNIEINELVVVSLEWLDYSECKDKCNFLLSMSYMSGKLYAKEASEDKWTIKKRMSPSIFLNLYQNDNE